MINGTLKGEIVSRQMFDPTLTQRSYAARIDIAVKGWTAGEKTETIYACYFPDFMRKRMDYFMDSKVKYCTVVFDGITVVPAQSKEKPEFIVILCTRIEM